MDSAATLRLSRAHYPVTALGPGRRLGLWLQGCPLACRGCVSQDTWDAAGGIPVSVAELAALVVTAMHEGADGLTVSGGEPLAQPAELAALLSEVDRARAHSLSTFDILVFTGFELAELDAVQRAAAGRADVLITGRYDVTQPTRLIWRGSANQVMRLQTPLAIARYSRFTDFTPQRPPIQVAPDDAGTWLVGVPWPGTIPALERALTAQGIDVASASWRRVRWGRPSPP